MSGAAARPAAEGLERALRRARRERGAALCAFVTAGFPSREGFPALLRLVAGAADVVEVGVPFSDPMADGLTIQRASRAALANGVTLRWILETLGDAGVPAHVPRVLMSYLNPLLAMGLERLAAAAADAGVSGVVVPDLPLEECGPLREALEARGLGLVQLVTPVTPPARLARLCEASRGFVYAVTVTGTTGGGDELPPGLLAYLERVAACSGVPVLAGFGIRRREQVRAIASRAEGAIVGSALIEALERGEDPAALLRDLRPAREERP